MNYVLLPRAERDLDEIADWYAGEGGLELALGFFDAAHKTFSKIAAHPEIGWRCRLRQPSLQSARVFLVESPFNRILIFYRTTSATVEVLRVVHGWQDLEQLFDRPDAE